MISAKNTDNKTATILDTSLLAIAGGFATAIMYPAFAFYGTVMIVSGSFGIASYFANYSKFDKLWKNLNLCKGTAYPLLKERKKTDISTIYTFRLPAGLSVEDFDRSKTAIENYLGRDIEIKYTYKAIQIEVFEKPMGTVDYEFTKCKGEVGFPVGYNRKRDLVCVDLSSGEPHLLIAGETGSGKSTALRSIITNIILDKPELELHLIDLKCGAEFQIFEKCKNVKTFSTAKNEAEDTLNTLLNETYRRYKLFRQYGCVDIKEYNSRVSKLDYKLIIIDEFADMQAQKDCIEILEELSAKARACGIHLILSTQRPDRTVLNGRIKANVTTVLGLKTTNETNSRIIIDDTGLENLKGKGDGILKRGNQTRIQCPYLSAVKARELIRHTYTEKTVNVAEEEFEGDLLC